MRTLNPSSSCLCQGALGKDPPPLQKYHAHKDLQLILHPYYTFIEENDHLIKTNPSYFTSPKVVFSLRFITSTTK